MKKIKESKKPYTVKNGVKVYIQNNHYTDSFGSQWNKFSKTQIDNEINTNSFDRFFNETGLKISDFTDKNILEVGSGAGRFTNIMLKYTSANIFSIDSSDAVYANYKNNEIFIQDRLKLYKASIYDLPFEKMQFDIVICFGVLQHTPDISRTIKCICEQVTKNGLIIIDFYPYNGFWTLISAKYMFRPFTKRMTFDQLYNFFKNKIPFLIKLYYLLKKNKLGILCRFLPIPDITKTIPNNLNPDLLAEMVLLDTIDMFSPEYDQPQKIKNIKNKISEQNFTILYAGKVKYGSFTSSLVRGKKN
jgi:SAM-dependent methyltransferase